MLDTYDVLKQIADVWDDMTNAEKSSLAIDLAKKTQMDTFLAILGNFESAEKAYTTALLSEGSAWKENSAYMESVEAHTKSLQQQWEQLVLSAPIENLEKALLSVGTAILKFANSDLGQTIIKLTALIGAIALANKALSAMTLLMGKSNAIGIFLSAISSLIVEEATLTQVTSVLTTALLSNPLFWGAAAVLGIAGIVKLIDKLNVTFEESAKKLHELNKEVKDGESKVSSLKQKLEEVKKELDKIKESKLQITDNKELENLQKQQEGLERVSAELRNQLDIEEQILEKKREQQATVAKQTMSKTTGGTIYNVDLSQEKGVAQFGESGLGSYDFSGKAYEYADKLLQGLSATQTKIHDCEEAMQGLNEETEEYQRLQDEQTEYNRQWNEMNGELLEILPTMQDIISSGQDLKHTYQDIFDRWHLAIEERKDTNIAGLTEEDVEAIEEENGALEEQIPLWEECSNALQDIQDAYDTLSKAVEEYNENQGYSAETLAKLNELSPQYLAALVNENGQLSLNVDLLQLEYEAQKQASIEKLNMARHTAIAELCEKQLAEATQGATQAIEEGGAKAVEKSADYDTLAGAARRAAAAMMAVEKGGFDTEEFKQQVEDINKLFDGLVDNVKNSTLQAGKATSKSAKSAAGSHKDAWVEAFKEEKAALKNLLETDQITEYEYYERLKDLNEKYFGEISGNHEKYIKEYRENEEEIYKGVKSVYDKVRDYLKEAVEQGYEKAINAIKKEEKKVLGEIKKQIDGLKKEKEKVLDGIQDEIDALKKQKEEVEKYWNDQIDAIKRENEELQKQNELLEYQQALQQAKAQKVMVYQDGKFQLTENESAVAQAEQNLANYQDQLEYEQQIQQMEDLRDAQIETIEERIEALEEYYDYMEEYYDKQIEAMEEYYDQVQEQYEAQIELLQNELDAFKEGFQQQENLENARLAAQVLGMNERKDLYEEELKNLKDYINEVNRMLLSLGEAGAEVDFSYTPITGYHKGIAEVAAVDVGVQARSSGDASFGKDEIALVGESPNAELLLGSKVNTIGGGKLMHLQKGTGIVNAESTATLAGLLNGLGNPSNVSNNRTMQQNFAFGNISLPNVTNAESFVQTLSREFNNYAIQYGNIRM